MLSLCAPVTAELRLASLRGGLQADEWQGVIAKLAAYVNEFKIAGLELLGITEREKILAALEQGGKYFHLMIASVPAEDLQLFHNLRRQQYLGSLLVDYLPEEAEIDEAEGQRLEALRAFAERALAVGLEVSAAVTLREWACRHLEDVVEAAVDLGCNRVICYRALEAGKDAVSAELLTLASAGIAKLRGLSYDVALGNCVPNCFSRLEERGCLGGIVSAFVDEKGLMYPCSCADKTSEAAGSLLEGDVSGLWRSEVMQAWRQRLPHVCLSCAKSDLCPGGCRALGCEGDICCGDPLIRTPYSEEAETLHEVVLEEDLCPKPRYAVRREDFGWALMRGSQVVPVSLRAGEILRLFDGKHTLAAIESRCGAAAISFIYSLYVRGFVDFCEADALQ